MEAPSALRGPALLALVFACLLRSSCPAAPLIIDDFVYTNSTSARTALVNTAAPPVSMVTGGEWGTQQLMVANCDFATRSTRCYWDRAKVLNLAAYTAFEIDVFAPDPGPVSMFTLYFRSGSGWFGSSVPLTRTGWQTLQFTKGNFIAEGSPVGWHQVDAIRLSPWKAAARNTYLAFDQLRATTPTVLLVRDTQSSNPEIVQQTIDRHLAWLGSYNVRCGVVTRAEVEGGLLQGSRLAILPYNEAVSETEMTRYENYVAGGGKLIVYYLLPSRLAALLGVRVTGWTPGDFAAWRFSDPNIPNLPARVLQASWNITTAVTNGTFNSRVTALWDNSLGQDTGKAAWLASDHGFFMSHVLLGDDSDQKSYALLCLVGSIVPEVWPTAAAGAIDQVGRIGPFQDYPEALAAIRAQGSLTLRSALVEAELAGADTQRARALSDQAAGRFSDAIFAAHAARRNLQQAYVLSLRPAFPEFRAIWEHHATGPYPGNWTAAAAALATNQFTAVFPNMLWGGLAHYKSACLPHSGEYNTYGDQIAACVSAAHARGLQVHVWKVNWNLLGAPQTFIDAMRTASRTQVTSSGAPMDWLCPSHPDNFALETNSMLEVVRNYAVDGIHFDYIRYPGPDSCYCTGCAARFQTQTGRTVPNWPADVLAPGSLRTAFLDWRRAQITRLVDTVYKQTKALKPSVQVSAAVFPDARSAYDDVGQDWRLWVTNGILDFVCPMDYVSSLPALNTLVGQQLADVAGRVPVYPGIGAWQIETDATLAQIQRTRALDTRGFILFELSPDSASNLLPLIGAGATAPDEPDTDNDLLPDAWEQRWFGNLATADLTSDTDSDAANDRAEYIAGTDPTLPTPAWLPPPESQQGQVQVSFLARGIAGEGYQNATRHYRLETALSISPGAAWSPVQGFEDRLAAQGVATLTHSTWPTNAAQFYRLRLWLQQK